MLSGARKQRLDELDDIHRDDIASGLGWKDAKRACQKEHTHGIRSCILCFCTYDILCVCFAPEALSLAPIEIGAVMSMVLVQMLFNSQMLTVVGEDEC